MLTLTVRGRTPLRAVSRYRQVTSPFLGFCLRHHHVWAGEPQAEVWGLQAPKNARSIFSRPEVLRPGSSARGARLCPPTAGRGARSEARGPRVAEASRGSCARLPGSGAPCPPRHQPPPVVSSPAALAAVAGSGSPASAQVGSSGGRQPGEPARPGRWSGALRSSAKPLTPAQSGLALPAASGTPNPAVPLGERRPAFRAWVALLLSGHPFETPHSRQLVI